MISFIKKYIIGENSNQKVIKELKEVKKELKEFKDEYRQYCLYQEKWMKKLLDKLEID